MIGLPQLAMPNPHGFGILALALIVTYGKRGFHSPCVFQPIHQRCFLFKVMRVRHLNLNQTLIKILIIMAQTEQIMLQ